MRVSLGRPASDESESLDNAAPTAVLAGALERTADGRLEGAVELATQHLATASEWVAAFPTIDLYLELARTRALLLLGEIGAAEQHAEAAYSTAVVDGGDFPRAIWSFARGIVQLVRGAPRLAVPALREAAGVFSDADRGFLRPTLAYLVMASALAGDISTAEEEQRGAHAASPSFDGIFGVDVARADAWLCAARGDVTSAARIAADAADVAANQRQLAFEALAVHDLARFAPSRATAVRLEGLCGAVDGRLVRAMAAHARGLADDDGAVLDDAARAFASITADLFGAEASFAAARAHRRSGLRASAFSAVERGKELAARCDGAVTEALRWVDQPEDLTPREREIAELAAGNISSREIAERLGISARTVDNLLGRVYAKLGISSRQELAELRGRRSGETPATS